MINNKYKYDRVGGIVRNHGSVAEIGSANCVIISGEDILGIGCVTFASWN